MESGFSQERQEEPAPEEPGQASGWYDLGNLRTEQRRDAEALECFLRAVALDPAHARAWNNLGAANERLGRGEDASAAYRKAMAADPRLLEPYLNLGRHCETRGELAAAAGFLRAGLERHPGHPMLVHLLAAASGMPAPRAPREHVVAYFDEFAPRFDEHLASLQYSVPAELAALLRPRLPARARVLDLGCGTGLMGAALARLGLELHGIDLSPRMAERARARGLYAGLLVADLDEGLAQAPAGSFQAVVAADVFIYVGELEGVFRGAAHALAPSGLFAFSVESVEGAGYALQSSGRYAHSLGYLRGLARASGFAEAQVAFSPLRRQAASFGDGRLLLLERL